ncbi:MAG: S9 family peptidase [Bacteroidetes bacterium]|nr:S9 family peptidase [Bacteroidota bacterium]
MRKALLLLLLPLHIWAQDIPFQSYKNYPFPTELRAAAQGSRIAWALDEQGVRNVYVAEGPAFIPRKLTAFTRNDGQEITSLSLSDDGKWVVFVRGGDHGSNYDAVLPINASHDVNPFKVQIASVPFAGGETKYLSEGDAPEISPDGKTVAFIKNGQVWMAPTDGAAAAKNLFTTRGSVSSLEWNPDGTALLFVSNRGDHSIIGIYTDAASPIKWIAASFYRDLSPRWSPDGKQIVFVRRPGAGGEPDSLMAKKHQPWSIYTAEISTGKETLLWKAPTTLRGSVPTTHGGTNLHWAANDRIVFLSYQDGWPHLYSIAATGGKESLLTPGNFMCEHITLSADRKKLTFSANTGNDPLDIERRHAAIVSVDKADMQVLTPGSGLEWTPVLTDAGNSLAFISATAQQSPLPAVMPLNGDKKIRLLCEDRVPAGFPRHKLVTPKQVLFKAADGVTVHADLFMPEGTSPSKKPAIVYVHGGPPRQMLLGWNYSDYYSNAYAANQYLASQGFVVLVVNYRLGIGYGYEFHQAKNGGAFGAAEYQDIQAAGKWLQAQSFVDAKRIGIYGGSYGGYLTAMALARDSKIFAAGVDIHGVHDWGTQAALMTAGEKYEKAPDYEKALQTAWVSSPVSSVKTWRSPVLIIHADDDRNVRFNQSVDLINRLEKHGVPFETMMVVDDTHHWMNWNNAVTVYNAVAEYFKRKLK